MTIGLTIKNARQKINLTQEELAVNVGLSRSYICDVENDRYKPSVKTLTALAKTLQIDLNFLSLMTEIQDNKKGNE